MNPAEIAERFGTPAYVYDLDAIRRAHADLRALQPLRKRELIVAQRDAGGGGRHQPSAAIFARRSA